MPKPYESKVVAIDLDGTLAEPTYPSPEIGAPIMKMVDAAIEYHRLGREVVIYTSRPDDHRDRIMRWLRQNGLDDVVYTVVTGKLKYALLIDDRAVSFPEAFEEFPVVESAPAPPLMRPASDPLSEGHCRTDSCKLFGCVPV